MQCNGPFLHLLDLYVFMTKGQMNEKHLGGAEAGTSRQGDSSPGVLRIEIAGPAQSDKLDN